MTSRVLSRDIVALLHHVELAASGWRDRLCEQLVLASLADVATAQDVESLTRRLSDQLGRTISATALTSASQRLIGRGGVVRAGDGRIALSQTGLADVLDRREATEALHQRAKSRFLSLASEICPACAHDDRWTQFVAGCLEPTVAELGARTYEFVSGQSANLGAVRSMAAFIGRFPEEMQPSLKTLIDRFLDPNDRAVRDYVLQELSAHFLGLAVSLPDAALSTLTGRLGHAVQLKLFLDTNFLFSVLDLHDNPANDAARELVALLKRLHGKLDYKLYVYPLTVDEVRRTLASYEHSFASTYITPKLGRAALATDAPVSGLVLRYLRAVSESSSRISAHDFLAPYLNDPVAVLRSKGVELYNANIDGLTTSQPVIDDIVGQQEFEARRYPDRAKPYEALRHDIALWHLVRNRRGATLISPLDAAYWVVTIDYRFLGFDAFKGRTERASPPVCVHPAVLLQMLQLWLPRDEALDRALMQGIRSLLPQVFDARAEESTVRILASLARYENVDDLDENTIAQVLMNQALGDRIRMVEDVREQAELVREAIVSELALATSRLAEEEAKRRELEESLAQRDAALAVVRQEHGATAEALRVETEQRVALDDRLAELERRLHESEDSMNAIIESHRRSWRFASFWAVAVISIGVAVALGMLLPQLLITAFEMAPAWANLFAWTGATGIAGFMIGASGHLLPVVRSTSWFRAGQTMLMWVVGSIWTVVLGLLVAYLWERF